MGEERSKEMKLTKKEIKMLMGWWEGDFLYGKKLYNKLKRYLAKVEGEEIICQ